MRIRPITLLAPLLIPLAGMTQTYKWVDSNGVVSYSQTPPPSIQTETVDIKQSPPASETDDNDELRRLRQRLLDNKKERQSAQEAQLKAKQDSEIKQKNCTAAHSNLEKLLNSGNRMMKTTDGNYLRLSEHERLQRIEAARAQIKANCNQ